MSLIYDALSRQSGPVAMAPAATPRASWWSRQSLQHRNGMLVAAGALIAAPLAFLAAGQSGRVASAPVTEVAAARPPVAPAPASADAPMVSMDPPSVPVAIGMPAPGSIEPADMPVAAVATAAPPTPAVAAAPPAPTQAQAGMAVALSAPAATPATLPPAAPTPAPMATMGQAQEEPQPISIKVERRGDGARTAAPAPDDPSVPATISAIEAAIADGDTARARQALTELEALLPSSSLTLLRMQAWVAHRGGDMTSAEQLYLRIAERVPDDENAGVNIALLSAGRGDVEDARLRLTRLAGRHTRSALVARALADIEAQAR